MLMQKKWIRLFTRTRGHNGVFLHNENFPIKIAQHLRQMGHDVLSSHEAGKANQRIPDEEVLAFAAESGRILLTLNRWDFIVLHTKPRFAPAI